MGSANARQRGNLGNHLHQVGEGERGCESLPCPPVWIRSAPRDLAWAFQFGEDPARLDAAAAPAREGHDAEGAEQVAALLHLEKARVCAPTPRRPACSPARLCAGRAPRCARHGLGSGVHGAEDGQPTGPDHVVELGQRGALRAGLREAAGRSPVRANWSPRAARLAALGIGAVGHRARVHYITSAPSAKLRSPHCSRRVPSCRCRLVHRIKSGKGDAQLTTGSVHRAWRTSSSPPVAGPGYSPAPPSADEPTPSERIQPPSRGHRRRHRGWPGVTARAIVGDDLEPCASARTTRALPRSANGS
jgi:hypothetical protein